MTGHKSWSELKSSWFDDSSPEARAAYEQAKAELDAKWEITCRYGNCTIFVSPDSSEGPDQDDGWGPIDCPCRGNEYDDALDEIIEQDKGLLDRLAADDRDGAGTPPAGTPAMPVPAGSGAADASATDAPTSEPAPSPEEER